MAAEGRYDSDKGQNVSGDGKGMKSAGMVGHGDVPVQLYYKAKKQLFISNTKHSLQKFQNSTEKLA